MIHHARSMSARCAKFQKSPALKSPVLERKLFPKIPIFEISSSDSEEEHSEKEDAHVEGPSDSCLPSRHGQGVPCELEGELDDTDFKMFDAVVMNKDGQVVTEVDKVPFTRKMLSCLGHGEWLDDEIMNAYMKLLQDRDTRLRGAAKGTRKYLRQLSANRIFHNTQFT